MVKGGHGVEQVSDHAGPLPEGRLALGQGRHGVSYAHGYPSGTSWVYHQLY